MLLPNKVGPLTLMRRLGGDAVTESFVGILDDPAGKQVVVRKVADHIQKDPAALAAFEARVRDLMAVRHPSLASLLDYVVDDDSRYVVEEWVDAIDLEAVLGYCRDHDVSIPHNVYLSLGAQICNGLEAMHSRPGTASGAKNVLHLALRPSSILLTRQGKVHLGNYGLAPTAKAARRTSSTPPRLEYLAPEQTHPDPKLGPPTDVFALGSILYELLNRKALFRANSNLKTIDRIRKASVTTQLMEVKEVLGGLDKVLYRALSLNPRHRYQRAFVMREDLRGLMAGYSFARIEEETQAFLKPLFETRSTPVGIGGAVDEVVPSLGLPTESVETTASLLRSSIASGKPRKGRGGQQGAGRGAEAIGREPFVKQPSPDEVNRETTREILKAKAPAPVAGPPLPLAAEGKPFVLQPQEPPPDEQWPEENTRWEKPEITGWAPAPPEEEDPSIAGLAPPPEESPLASPPPPALPTPPPAAEEAPAIPEQASEPVVDEPVAPRPRKQKRKEPAAAGPPLGLMLGLLGVVLFLGLSVACLGVASVGGWFYFAGATAASVP